MREIARAIGRDPGPVSCELGRNAATRGGKQEYRAGVAQWKAQRAAKRPKTARPVSNEQLREYTGPSRATGRASSPNGPRLDCQHPRPSGGCGAPRATNGPLIQA